MKVTIRDCALTDLFALSDLAYETYNETFRHLNTDETMDAYLASAFSIDKLETELKNPSCRFYLLYADEQLAGYLKLNDVPSQTDLNDPESLEIERIYLKKSYQGQGLGGALFQKAVEIAEKLGKSYLWLGVWEKNTKAIVFYRKLGFYESGTHDFVMGDEKQQDIIMRRGLNVDQVG